MKKRNIIILVAICLSIISLLKFRNPSGINNLSVFGSGNYYSADKAFSSIKGNSSMSTGTVFLAMAVSLVVHEIAGQNAQLSVTQDIEVSAAELAEITAEAGEAVAATAEAAVTLLTGLAYSKIFSPDKVMQNVAMHNLD
ncbi:MAG: hypothetical protein ACQPRJ_01800 [Solitalea-like symbiont of Acarus siro]